MREKLERFISISGWLCHIEIKNDPKLSVLNMNEPTEENADADQCSFLLHGLWTVMNTLKLLMMEHYLHQSGISDILVHHHRNICLDL